MPTPSGRRSSWRTGGGLTISNALKSIKPSSRDCHAIGRCDQGDKLAGDFVDHHKLRIFATAGPGHPRGGRNSHQNRHESEQGRRPGLPDGRDPARQQATTAGQSSPSPRCQVRAADTQLRRKWRPAWPRAGLCPTALRSFHRTLGRDLRCHRLSCTGDEITYAAAGPFAQIDQTAAIAAEGELASLLVTTFLQMGHFSLRALASHWLPTEILATRS